MTLEQAVEFINLKNKTYDVKGFTGTLKEIAKEFDISYSTMVCRMNKGIPIDRAILKGRITK